MISYNILHYNRPYLLEPNIKILRKLLPGIQIIISDDGSDPLVVDKVKHMDIDDFVTVEHREGSCSDAIEQGVKLCKFPFYIFSEDDFWYLGAHNEYGIKAGYIPTGCLVHPAKFRLSGDKCGIQEGVEKISGDKDVVLVALAYQSFGKLSQTKKRNTNNWPYMMRTNDRQIFSLSPGLNVKLIQNDIFFKIKSCFPDCYVDNINQCVYAHVGSPFCVNEPNYLSRLKGFRRWYTIIPDIVIDESHIENIKKLLNNLTNLYLQGKFFIDVDEMFQSNINQAFISAIDRVKNVI